MAGKRWIFVVFSGSILLVIYKKLCVRFQDAAAASIPFVQRGLTNSGCGDRLDQLPHCTKVGPSLVRYLA